MVTSRASPLLPNTRKKNCPTTPGLWLILSDEHAPPHKSALPDPSYHWTTEKAWVFLGALAECGRVGEAVRLVGMSRQSAYRLRARLEANGLFTKAWDVALTQGREKRQARRRAARKVTVLPPESDIFGLGR